MSTFRIPRLSARRRRLRRPAALRRSWTMQRLETRCVMAADLLFGEPADSLRADTHETDNSSEVPSLFALVRTTHTDDAATGVAAVTDYGFADQGFADDDPTGDTFTVEFLPDRVGLGDGGSETAAPGLTLPIDLSDDQPVKVKLVERQQLALTFDAAQLDQLYGASHTLSLQVIYDAEQWDTPSVQSVGDSGETQLRIASLAGQAVSISIDVQPADALDDASVTNIVIKLLGDGVAVDADSERSFTEQLPLGSGHNPSQTLETITGSNFADPTTSRFEQTDLGLGICLIDKTQDDSGSPDATMNSGEMGETQPLDESAGEPLPESRRETVERSARQGRRTLDIRAPGPSSWNSTTASRAPVSQESLATQAALASVYVTEDRLTPDSSRWLLEPKAARLQVATFLLSRGQREGSSVVINVTKPVVKIEEPAQENSLSLAQPVMPVDASVSLSAERALTKIEDKKFEEADEESSPSEPVVASIVDRLLGSPVSLAAILGLTVVARLAESDENIN